MYLPNCKLEYEGFDPPSRAKRSIADQIIKLLNKSPSDSFLKLSLTSGEAHVDGFIRINSRTISFESNKVGSDPVQIVHEMCVDLFNQLESWSNSRTR